MAISQDPYDLMLCTGDPFFKLRARDVL